MIIQTTGHVRRASAWLLNPGRLIDRLLDQFEKRSIVVAPVGIESSAYCEAHVEARFRQFQT
jgi:hypothetical protein